MSKTISVIGETSLEYNDEIYDNWGRGEIIGKTAFTDIDKAKDEAVRQLEAFFSSYYTLRSFSYDHPSNDFKYFDEFEEDENGGDENCHVDEYISWCKDTGRDWTQGVPQFVTIHEITFED